MAARARMTCSVRPACSRSPAVQTAVCCTTSLPSGSLRIRVARSRSRSIPTRRARIVDSVLQGITYSNADQNPTAPVQIDYTFSDGNSGAHGLRGEPGDRERQRDRRHHGGQRRADGERHVDIYRNTRTRRSRSPALTFADVDGNGGDETATFTAAAGSVFTRCQWRRRCRHRHLEPPTLTLTGTIAQTQPPSLDGHRRDLHRRPRPAQYLTLVLNDNGNTPAPARVLRQFDIATINLCRSAGDRRARRRHRDLHRRRARRLPRQPGDGCDRHGCRQHEFRWRQPDRHHHQRRRHRGRRRHRRRGRHRGAVGQHQCRQRGQRQRRRDRHDCGGRDGDRRTTADRDPRQRRDARSGRHPGSASDLFE